MSDRDRSDEPKPSSADDHVAPDTDAADDAPPVPGHKNYLIFCDETGTGGAVHYGFGSLWVPWQRRGDLYRIVAEVRERHGYHSEIKWNKVSRRSEAFYRDLLTVFFRPNWLMFHTLAVRKGYVDKRAHEGDFDLARRKHFTMFLANKVAYFNAGATDKRYHVRVDPIASWYPKADEVVHIVSNRQVRNAANVTPIHSFRTVDSKESLGVQLCDFLLGATLAQWQEDIAADHKQRTVKFLAHHLGWSDMLADTFPTEWKFNVWSFWDPTAGRPRERETRGVKLSYPMRPFRPSKFRKA